MNQHHLLVTFDLTDDRRRRRLCRFLSGWGQRVQYSAFECRVRESSIEEFETGIREQIDPCEDRIALYYLCHACQEKTIRYGTPLGALVEDGWFL